VPKTLTFPAGDIGDIGIMDLQQGIIFYLILVGSLSVHEWAHAIVADKLGDPTPASQGRVTLNPISHIDPIGTVLIPLFMIFMSPGFAIFGWGRPVPVNPSYFRHKVRDDLLTTLAGPGSNLAICGVTIVLGSIILRLIPNGTEMVPLFQMVILLNTVLIIFNLLPIPPLDGSRVMRHVVRMSEETYMRLATWGFVILIVLINIPAFRQTFGFLIWTTASFFLNLMILLGGYQP
jgi:Zn-dependent protease